MLILDEPTAALDDASVAEIIAPLTALSRGRTTLLITHDSRILATADDVVRLEGGRIYSGTSSTPSALPRMVPK